MPHQDVKPWEPVRGWWIMPGGSLDRHRVGWDWRTGGGYDCARRIDQCLNLRVTLANGQTIIVRKKPT